MGAVATIPLLPVLSDTVKGDWQTRKALSDAFQKTDDLRPLYELEPFSTDPDWTALIDGLDAALPRASAKS